MESGWRQKPKLTRQGQTIFWNRQAPTYEMADMTNDNSQEIEYLIEQFQENKYEQIITLGGAVGCRDPHMILQKAYCFSSGGRCLLGSEMPKEIFFNDLAPLQVHYAEEKVLAQCIQNCGLQIRFHAGNAIEACKVIGNADKKSRIFFLGVYKSDGFFQARPQENYPENGFSCYLNNRQILGDYFWYDKLCLEKDRIIVQPLGIQFYVTQQPEMQEEIYRHLRSQIQESLNQSFVGLQVVGAHKDSPGFFLSHWYNLEPLRRVLEIVFDPKEFSITHQEFPKGYLFHIQRKVIKPKGAITMLNNVLGNILPNEQLDTLFAIQKLM